MNDKLKLILKDSYAAETTSQQPYMNNKLKAILKDCTDKEMTKPWPYIDTARFFDLVVNACADIADSISPVNNVGDHIVEQMGCLKLETYIEP